MLRQSKYLRIGYWEGPIKTDKFSEFFMRMLAQGRNGILVVPEPFELIENEIELPEDSPQ